MSSVNRRPAMQYTQNVVGTVVPKINAEKQLTRLTLAAMLWEDQFYMDGKSSADLIKNLIPLVKPEFVEGLAFTARTKFKLRHVPLLLMRELARTGKMTAAGLNNVIQRPDELSEFLGLYWKEKKQPLSNQVKKGLASAFVKFNEYQLAKWDKNSAAISLRDVMFLTHAKPLNAAQAILFNKVANKQLETPDTWETQLSAGADKAVTFLRLMTENKLGALAFLRNLRNMVESGINTSVIRAYAKTLDVTKVLPFRYIAAARIMPQFEDMLEDMMLRSLQNHEKLPGKTVLLVDISGSMFGTKVSKKSELDRFDAACALAILAREICEEAVVLTYADRGCVAVPPRRGFALAEAMKNSQSRGGTDTGLAVKQVQANYPDARVIVFTDEQSYTIVPPAKHSKSYIFNVGSYENGINHSSWTTITGFSEAMIDYVQLVEQES